MSTIIGIDLGTTHSAAAFMAEDGPRLIPNALGERLTPSVVGLDPDGKLLVGRAAKELQVLHPDRCAALFKRHMGTDWTAKLAGRKFTPEELSSLVLRALKTDAEAHFGTPVERAVITVPAYFNDQQRKATISAGRIAGLSVERIFNEPTAAALAYGFHQSREDKILLVFDLGGGTFDVSVVELFEGALEVRASSGESFLGGEDFTRCLAARVLEGQGQAFERAEMEAPHLVSRLIQQCELAKCRLSQQEMSTIRVPDRAGNFPAGAPEVEVARKQFETWTEHILSRIETPIRRVLGDARLKREQIDQIVLVGGATRMPMVIDRVTQLLGKSPKRHLNPDEVVALGAAVQAGLHGQDASVEDLVVTDVVPFTLGVTRGLKMGGLAGPLRELYRRELAAHPYEALTDRCAELLTVLSRPGQLIDLVIWRWQAATVLQRYDVIHADLPGLRPRLGWGDEGEWARVLFAATDSLAWSFATRDRELFASCAHEVYGLAYLAEQMPGSFDRLDMLCEVAPGWQRLYRGDWVPRGWRELMPLSWCRSIEEVRPVLYGCLDRIAAAPVDWLSHFDVIQRQAPMLLTYFGQLLRQLEMTADEPIPAHDPATLQSFRLDGCHPGREIITASGWGEMSRLHMYLVGERLFYVSMQGPKEWTEGQHAERFFESFQPL